MAHHGHGHDGQFDWAAEAARLDRWADVERPLHEAVAEWLDVPVGATVIDIGCGAGGMTTALAAAAGRGGTVVAIDHEPAMLELASARVAAGGSGATLRTLTVDLDAPDWTQEVLAAAGGGAQVVWASNVMHHTADEAAGVGRLAGLLAPDGVVALAEGGLPMRWCSLDLGHDEVALQARITAASEEWFPTVRAAIDGAVPRTAGWPEVLASLGLEVRTKSFLLDHPAPASEAVRRHVVDHLVATLERIGDRLSEADRAAIDALTGGTDPASVMRRDDVFLLTARTLHTGTRA